MAVFASVTTNCISVSKGQFNFRLSSLKSAPFGNSKSYAKSAADASDPG